MSLTVTNLTQPSRDDSPIQDYCNIVFYLAATRDATSVLSYS